MTCETCGQALATKYPAKEVPGGLYGRALRGAEALKTAVATDNLARLRRVDLTLHLMTVLGTGHLGSLTSWNERIRGLSQDLDRRLPGLSETGHPTGHETHGSCRSNASESALQAARQAISELGHDANHQALLKRADAIWRRPGGDKF